MAFLSEVGTLASPASTGNQIVTLDSGIWGGESGKVVLIWSSTRIGDGAEVHAFASFGCGVSASSRASVGIASLSQEATSDSERSHNNLSCISVPNAAAGVLEEADFVSFAANQFTINWTTVWAPSSYLYNYMVLGGDGLTDVYLDEITSPASTGEQAYTGVGFQPDCLLHFAALQTTVPATAADAHMQIGIYDGTSQRAVEIHSVDALATSSTARKQASVFGGWVNASGLTDNEVVSAVSLDADGYTLDWTTVDGGAFYRWVLALKGIQAKVLTGDQPATDTTSTHTIGFSPKAALAITHMGAGTGFSDDVPDVLTGQSHKFDGENDYITSTPHPLGSYTGDWTMCGWVRLSSAASYPMIFSANSSYMELRFQAGTAQLECFSHVGVTGSAVNPVGLTLNQWTHVAVTYQSSTKTFTLFEGASEGNSVVGAGTDIEFGINVTLGARAGLYPFPGKMDDLRIYKNALSSAQLAEVMVGANPAGATLAWWLALDGDYLDSAGSNDGTLFGQVNDHARIGIGGWSANGQAFSGAVDEDGQSTTDADRIQDSNEFIKHIDHAQVVKGSASLAASAGNLIETWTDTDGTQREHSLLVLGETLPTIDTCIAEVGTFASPAATGQQTIQLDNSKWQGTTPKVVLFWANSVTADGVSAHATCCFGVALSSTSRAAIAVLPLDAQATSDAHRLHDNTNCIVTPNLIVDTYEEADFVSFGANQFTINWTKAQAAGAYLVNYMVLGGDDLTDVYLDEIITPTGTGVVSYTGVGFQPDCLLGFSICNGSVPPAIATQAYMNLGIADGTGNRKVNVYSQDAQDTSATNRLAKDGFVGYAGGVEGQNATVDSLDADGYSLDWVLNDDFPLYHWVLCLKGIQAKVLTADQPATDTTSTHAIGFAPKAALLLTHMGPGTGFSDDVPDGSALTQSLKLDGENDYVAVGATGRDSDFSASFWMRTPGITGSGEYICDHGVNQRAVNVSTGMPGCLFSPSHYGEGTTTVDDNVWHHVTVVFNYATNELHIYVDGGADEYSDIVAGSAGADIDDLKVARYGSVGSFFYTGQLSDFRLWNKVLTEDEAKYLWSFGGQGSDPVDSNVHLELQFDGDYLDETANNNDGTLFGQVNNHARIGIGGWDASNNMAFSGAVDESGQGTTDADRVQDSNEAIKHIDHAQTVVGSCSIAASGNDLVETWTDTDGTQREHSMLVLGAAASRSRKMSVVHDAPMRI